ncbi:hypothetical protein STEG23_019305, partial [Scotinomys teguina]
KWIELGNIILSEITQTQKGQTWAQLLPSQCSTQVSPPPQYLHHLFPFRTNLETHLERAFILPNLSGLIRNGLYDVIKFSIFL